MKRFLPFVIAWCAILMLLAPCQAQSFSQRKNNYWKWVNGLSDPTFYNLEQASNSECPFLDVRLWAKVTAPLKARVADPFKEAGAVRRVIGIKAMPGKTGYGGGHKSRDRTACDDAELHKLRSLIGDDADAYASFYDATAYPPTLPPEQNGHVAPRRNARTTPPPRNMTSHTARSECGRVHGPNWLQWLGHLRGTPACGMEIGTFEGDSAEWMCENIATAPGSCYHCVDPFTGSVEHKLHNVPHSQLEQKARAKLARFKNVIIHKGYSERVVRDFKSRLDFCYIDGDHSTRSALRDGVLVFDLLKVGGIAIFDDFEWKALPNELQRPKKGIEAFLSCYAAHLTVLYRGYQVAIKKTSE